MLLLPKPFVVYTYKRNQYDSLHISCADGPIYLCILRVMVLVKLYLDSVTGPLCSQMLHCVFFRAGKQACHVI